MIDFEHYSQNDTGVELFDEALRFDRTKYRQNEITKIELLREDPTNSQQYPAITSSWRCPGNNMNNEIKTTING